MSESRRGRGEIGSSAAGCGAGLKKEPRVALSDAASARCDVGAARHGGRGLYRRAIDRLLSGSFASRVAFASRPAFVADCRRSSAIRSLTASGQGLFADPDSIASAASEEQLIELRRWLASRLLSPMVKLDPGWRRFLLVLIDLTVLPLSLWITALLLPPGSIDRMADSLAWIQSALLPIGLGVYLLTGQYKGLTRYSSQRSVFGLTLRNALVVALVAAEGALSSLPLPPTRFWPLLWLLLTSISYGVRQLLRELLLSSYGSQVRQRLVIYGAGAAGAQLAAALHYDPTTRIVAFVDDDPSLWGRRLHGVSVISPSSLVGLQRRTSIDQVMLALPSISRQHCRRIVEGLQDQGFPVLQVPSLEEIRSGRARIDALRPVAIDDLLGREPAAPDPELLAAAVAGRSVLVTGAGGSIGSELCRQILRLQPSRLVLLELSEPSLYQIDQELQRLQQELLAKEGMSPVEVVPVLGSVLDQALLERLLRRQGVEVVFHAAAYKHVPLVELNPLSGLLNNVMGTRSMVAAATNAGVRQVLLISTDKAVRPTNVMGASKRLAELIVQAQARCRPGLEVGCVTNFALVRFGNVLGSSGSVVPLFREQIARGGPITLTHRDIIRYFMTIPEAVQLVLQASAISERDARRDPRRRREADVFLLDMGAPVKIFDLARQMVQLSGLKVRDDAHPDGDIEIVFTGLRPGEKLYEELLIEGDARPTCHPLIFRAPELAPENSAASSLRIWNRLDALGAAIDQHHHGEALQVLGQLVPEWKGAQRLQPRTRPPLRVVRKLMPADAMQTSAKGQAERRQPEVPEVPA